MVISVNGTPLSAAAEAAALHRMRQPFRCRDVEKAVRDASGASASSEFLMRAADRLIQRERKAGKIVKGSKNGDWLPA